MNFQMTLQVIIVRKLDIADFTLELICHFFHTSSLMICHVAATVQHFSTMTALLGEMAHLMFAEMVFIFTLFPTDIALQHWEWVEEDDGIDGRLLWLRTGAGLLGHGGDAVTVAGEGGGGHQTERYYPCLGWPLVASPPLQHRTGHSSLERNCPGLGRLGEDAVTVVREGGDWSTQPRTVQQRG